MIDLQALSSHIKSGFKVKDAVDLMILETETYIRANGFGGKFGDKALTDPATKKWSQVQLWKAMKLLMQHNVVHQDVLLFTAFSGDSEALKALVRERILDIKQVNNKRMVMASSPLYQSAFEKMINEQTLQVGLNILEVKSAINKIQVDVKAFEEEFERLQSGLGKKPLK